MYFSVVFWGGGVVYFYFITFFSYKCGYSPRFCVNFLPLSNQGVFIYMDPRAITFSFLFVGRWVLSPFTIVETIAPTLRKMHKNAHICVSTNFFACNLRVHWLKPTLGLARSWNLKTGKAVKRFCNSSEKWQAKLMEMIRTFQSCFFSTV